MKAYYGEMSTEKCMAFCVWHEHGTHSKPSKLLENAQTPTSQVHAALGVFSHLIELLLKAITFTKNITQLPPFLSDGRDSFIQ